MFSAGFSSENNHNKDIEMEDKDCVDSNGSVESVCFSPVLPVVVTGSLSGVIGVWDVSTQQLRQRCLQNVRK